MPYKGCSNIPRELCDWITILSKSLPLRAVHTRLELLIGAMLRVGGVGGFLKSSLGISK